MAASFAQPRWTRRFWWLAVAVAAVVALTQAVRSGGDAQAELPVVAPQEPINQVDARLLAMAGSPNRIMIPGHLSGNEPTTTWPA
jgi:hypothetical protein